MQSAPSLPLLQGPFWPGLVAAGGGGGGSYLWVEQN